MLWGTFHCSLRQATSCPPCVPILPITVASIWWALHWTSQYAEKTTIFFFHVISLLGFPAEVAQLEAAKQPQKGEVRAVAKGGAWPCAYHKVFSCWSGVASLWALKGRYLSTFWELHWKNFGFCQLEDSRMLKLAFFWSCVWLKVFFLVVKKHLEF